MRRRHSFLCGILLLSVALLFLVPAVGSAQTCNPNHPETCECSPNHPETCPDPSPTPTDCNPYHPETCPEPESTHTGAAFAVSETNPDLGADLTLAAWVSIGIIGLALVLRRFIISSSRE